MASFLQRRTNERNGELRDREGTERFSKDERDFSVFPYTREWKEIQKRIMDKETEFLSC